MKQKLFLLLMELLPLVANAYDAKINGIYYNFNGGEAEVTYLSFSNSDNKNAYSGSVTIPKSVIYNGITYTVTSIGNYAFLNCEGLTSITVSNSIVNIGYGAFQDCSGLTSVTIGSGVTSIGDYAFYNCNSLTEVHISDVAAWCRIEFGGNDASPLDYAHHLFLNDKEIKDLVIPDGVTDIGYIVFRRCSGLTSVTIPETVTNIGVGAFSRCDGLTTVNLSNSIITIDNYAFDYCI